MQTNDKCRNCGKPLNVSAEQYMSGYNFCSEKCIKDYYDNDNANKKYTVYFDDNEFPELFQVGKTMYEISSGKQWNATKRPKHWRKTTITAESPIQAIKKLIDKEIFK